MKDKSVECPSCGNSDTVLWDETNKQWLDSDLNVLVTPEGVKHIPTIRRIMIEENNETLSVGDHIRLQTVEALLEIKEDQKLILKRLDQVKKNNKDSKDKNEKN